jgi:hypothetical protein
MEATMTDTEPTDRSRPWHALDPSEQQQVRAQYRREGETADFANERWTVFQTGAGRHWQKEQDTSSWTP